MTNWGPNAPDNRTAIASSVDRLCGTKGTRSYCALISLYCRCGEYIFPLAVRSSILSNGVLNIVNKQSRSTSFEKNSLEGCTVYGAGRAAVGIFPNGLGYGFIASKIRWILSSGNGRWQNGVEFR